ALLQVLGSRPQLCVVCELTLHDCLPVTKSAVRQGERSLCSYDVKTRQSDARENLKRTRRKETEESRMVCRGLNVLAKSDATAKHCSIPTIYVANSKAINSPF